MPVKVRHPIRLAVGLALACGLSVAAGQELTRAELAFVKSAAHLGHAEVEAAEVVLRKASEPQVRRLAEQMKRDHTTANEELKAWAAAQGVEVPGGPSPLQWARIRMLGALEASHLARRYVDKQGIDAHEEAIALYQRAAREARQRELKAYVERQLPVLRHHLEAARGVKAYLAGAARASAPSAPPPPSTSAPSTSAPSTPAPATSAPAAAEPAASATPGTPPS